MAHAYGSSILLMMASPFVLLALLAFLIYRSVRRGASRADTAES